MACSKPAKKVKGENTSYPNWLELPSDITKNILQRLGVVKILTSARNVCPLWWNICKDPLMWRTINIYKDIEVRSDFDHSHYDLDFLVKICCYAIDLSCGHLEEIVTDDFANDYLLQYIADRASHLRRMMLANFSAHRVSDKGLHEAVKKLSLLEVLNISFYNISKDSLEVIGRSCPLLKSLKYMNFVSFDSGKSNELTFAIAKSMLGLRYLTIYGIMLSDVGLLAILDGCDVLESLNVYLSVGLDLSESVLNRCRHQIKHLQLPKCKF